MKYYLAGLTAFILWGFSSLAVKPLSGYASPDILFYRVVFSFLLILAINLLFRRDAVRADLRKYKAMDAGRRKRALLLTFSGGLFLTSNWIFFIILINHISVKAASFAYLVCPIVTTLLARIFLKEKLDPWQWAAVALSASGCWLLSLGHWEDVLYSLIVAFSYGAYLVSQRANAGFDSLVMLSLHVGIALVFLLAAGLVYPFSVPSAPFFYRHMAVLVIVLTVIPLALNLFALKGVGSSGIGMLLYVNPVVNFVMAILYFKEDVSVVQMVSYALIVISIAVFNKNAITGSRPAGAPPVNSLRIHPEDP